MYNLTISKISSYDFTGTINAMYLSDKELEAINIQREHDQDIEQLIDVSGSFNIEWDDDIPMPQIECLYLVNGAHTLELDLDQCNTESLEQDISESGQDMNWAQDHAGDMTDRAQDCYEDR